MGQGTTRLVMGADQNGPKYTVQETVIDGKKTLILDHNDLARLLQSNNQAVVLQQGVSHILLLLLYFIFWLFRMVTPAKCREVRR